MSGEASRARGRQRELAVMKHYRALGFVVYRLAAGCADVVLMKAGHGVKLAQVKSTRKPYDHFPPVERDALMHEAIAAGAAPVLMWWPKGGPLVEIPACEWPSRSRVRFPIEGVIHV